MADYINREVVRNELYDADAITMKGVAILNNFPTADVVEVVRCKDCKSWKCLREDRGLCKHPTFTLDDDTIDPLTEPNDFCSYGERRTNGN